MMKRKGKVLSLVLAAILTVSSGSVVQAADTSTKVQNTQAVKAEAQSLEAQSSIVTVSYTHLDVYKRQVPRCT